MRGVDVNLEQNLEACFKLKYDTFEIIFSTADDKDPAIEVVRKVMKKYPKIDSTLIIGEEVVGVNPKINNLIRSYRMAKYDVIWIIDSNIFVHPDTLTHAAVHIKDPKVGLVHHTPRGTSAQSLGAQLESHFLNTAHAKIYIVFNWLAVESCVMGKSNLIRKTHLDQVGGLESFGKYLAEDNMIGTAIMTLGLKHVMSSYTADQPLMNLSIQDYIVRRTRWTRLRAYSLPGVTLVEPFSESILCGIVGAFTLAKLLGISSLYFFFYHMILWHTIDCIMTYNLSRTAILNLPLFFLTWIVREVSAFPIYLLAIFGSNRVFWRGRKYRLKLGGTVVQIRKPAASPPRKPRLLRSVKKHFSSSDIPSFFVLDLIIYAFTSIWPFKPKKTSDEFFDVGDSHEN